MFKSIILHNGLLTFLGPQPPIDISTTVYENNSIVVDWTPDNSTGYAKLFKVYVTFENTIYETPLDCDSHQKKTMIFEVSGTHIEAENLEPFSRYSLRIVAVNDFGISGHSKKHFFNTKPSPPSAPRDISIDLDDINNGGLTVSGTLKWSQPCHLNGLFSLYTITLKGSNPINPDEHSLVEASSIQNLKLGILKRGYQYDVKVQALSSGFVGDSGIFSFDVPSGSKLNYFEHRESRPYAVY